MQYVVNRPPVFHNVLFSEKVDTQKLLAEPSLFCCSPGAVEMKGGPLANQALLQIRELFEFNIRNALEKGLAPVCDVKVHRLFPHQFPCIPGWHCDSVPRGGYSGQPNFSLVHPGAFHVSLILSDRHDGICGTEFVDQAVRLGIYDPEHVFRAVHAEIERHKPSTCQQPDGRFCFYTQHSIHRGRPATKNGVRMFMRFSMIEKPYLANSVSRQMQIYQTDEIYGW